MSRELRVDQDLCISCGFCVAVAPGVFSASLSRASVSDQGGDPELIERCIRSCPVHGIAWHEERTIPAKEDTMAIWKCTECGFIREGRCKPQKCPQCEKMGVFEKEA